MNSTLLSQPQAAADGCREMTSHLEVSFTVQSMELPAGVVQCVTCTAEHSTPARKAGRVAGKPC